MRLSLRVVLFGIFTLLAFSVPTFAHHGSAVYDVGKKVTVKGTVTRFVWENPHILLLVDAKDDSGNIVHWIIESRAPSNVTNYGWTKFTFKPGDEVLVDVTPGKNLATNGSTVGRFSGRIIINGKLFSTTGDGEETTNTASQPSGPK